jgi:hypothetical protein
MRAHVLVSSEAAVRNQLQNLEGVLHVVAKQWQAAGLESEDILKKIEPGLDLEKIVSLAVWNGQSFL